MQTNFLLPKESNFNKFWLPYIGGGISWAKAQFLPVRDVMEGGEEAHSLPPKTPTINSVTSLHTATRVMANKPVKGQDR